MARYFFDLHNDLDVCDDEGRELPDLAAMRDNAIVEAREMMTQSIHDGKLDLNHRIEVRNEAGAVIHVLDFADAVRVIPRRAA